MDKNQGDYAGRTAAVYIDGFNLYHPIHAYNEPFLKWIDLWRLSEIICARHSTKLIKVTFCTAVPHAEPEQRDRHNTFNAAQRSKGVIIINGHHVVDPDTGKRSEKQSDINLALSLILDAEDKVYQCAYLLSADSDHAATARVFRERHPEKVLFSVAPPNKPVPQKVMDHAQDHFVLNKLEIETCVMGPYITGKTGNPIRRPKEYDPPDRWMHPDKRPRKK